MPGTVDFLVITMHHPPVADVQTHLLVDHNPRPNEFALRDYLAEKAKKIHARILVSAGHIHNYERHERTASLTWCPAAAARFPTWWSGPQTIYTKTLNFPIITT